MTDGNQNHNTETLTPEQLIQRLTKEFPPSAIRTREGSGGKRFSYVDGMTVVRRLNRACGPAGWSSRVVSTQIIDDGKTSKGTAKRIMIAVVELTIPGLGTRTHMGVQSFTEGGGEDLLKGAITDAHKKCATLFGVADSLYGPDIEEGIEEAERREENLRSFFAAVETVAVEQGLPAAQALLAEAKAEWMTFDEVKEGIALYRRLEKQHAAPKPAPESQVAPTPAPAQKAPETPPVVLLPHLPPGEPQPLAPQHAPAKKTPSPLQKDLTRWIKDGLMTVQDVTAACGGTKFADLTKQEQQQVYNDLHARFVEVPEDEPDPMEDVFDALFPQAG